MAAVPYVQKRHSQALGYSFAGETELIEKLRPAMIQAGITCRPVAMQLVASGEYTTRKGATMRFVCLLADYEFSHGMQSERVQVMGEAADSGDKASPKAMTLAQKYALRQYFLIETGDDPDIVAHHRGSPMNEAIGRAARAIEREHSHTELDRLVGKVSKQFKGQEGLTGLLALIEKRRSALPARTKPASK